MSDNVFNLEKTAARMRRTADLAAVLRNVSAAELTVLGRWFGDVANLENHKGAAGVGKALGVLVDAERARREWAHARVNAEFDAITAGLTPAPHWTTDD